MKYSGRLLSQVFLNKKVVYTFFILSFILIQLGVKAQLSGTYTIGGASPSYSSFTAAISALNTLGVNGAVTFNVRSGTYTERLNFGSITGASQVNTITFQKDPSSTTLPILQYTSTSSSLNYVVRLNGAKYINFKKLHVKAVSGSYSNVFELRGINQYLSIDSCILEAPITTISSTYRAVINELSGSANRTSDIEITNNEIIGGSYGIYAYGYSTGIYYHRNWIIEENTIKDWNNNGVYIQNYFDTVSVADNVITQKSSSTNTTSYGIQTYRLYNSHVEKNVVELTATNAYGIYLNQHYGYNGARFRLSNNMVSLTNPNPSGTRWGIYAGSCNYADVVHNSIYIANSDVAGSNKCIGIYGTSGSINAYKNNAIEVNSANPLAYGMYFPGSASQSHNCIWISDQGVPCNKILGTGSITKYPYFNSPTDLHTSSIDLNNAGQALTAFTDDIDGQTRNTTTPDIGADEFTPAANDAGLSAITNFTVCSGSNSMEVNLKNLGTNTLTSINIGWSVKVNTGSYVTQTPYSYSGSLLSGSDTVIPVGNYSMVSGSTYEFKMWTYSPNNSTDGNNANDTVYKTFTTSLSGIYTIGGASPDYATIQAAATDMKNKGVCGSVDFHIRPGSYNELVTIESAKGLTGNNTATFRKDPNFTGDVFWFRSGRPLTLSAAENIIIRDLVMETKSSTNVIYLTGANTNISIINNTLRGINTSSSSASLACIYNTSSVDDINRNIKIDSNRFVRGSAMAQLRGYNTTVGTRNVGTQITNNTYDSAGYYGISIQYEDTITVAKNIINDNGLYITQTGLNATYVYNFDISQNQFYLTENISSNTYGVRISYGGGTSANPSSLNNNHIYAANCLYGIYFQTVNYVNVYYNTVRIDGSASTNSYAAYFNYGVTYLKNNNFSNEREGRVIYVRTQNTLPLSDNNNFYTNSKTLFAYGGGYRTSFAAWQVGMSRDISSLSVEPHWRSSNGPTPNNSLLNGAASNNTGVSEDVFGFTRSTTPDIGCVEFTPSINDASISEVYEYSVCPGSTPVKVRLKNAGNNTLTQARIQWNVKVNTGAPVSQTAFTWTGNLPSYSDTLITIGNYTFVGANTYQITAYIDQANNVTDPVKTNDTSSSIPTVPSMSGVYTVGGSSPDYATLTLALNALQTNGICGPVILNVRGGSYYGQVYFNTIQGTNSTNTITVQTDPSSTTQADFYNNNIVFNINSIDYFTFKNLKIRTTGNSSTLYISGSTNFVTFENDSIIGSSTATNNTGYAVFRDQTGTGAIQNDLTIDNCIFLNGSYSMYLYGNSSSGTYSQNRIKVTNSKLLDFYYTGIYAYYCPSLELSNNSLTQRNMGGSGYGYNLIYCDSSKLLSSDITIKYGYGVYAQNCYGTINTPGLLVANNFVKQIDSTVTSTSYGIYNYNTTYSQVVYNTIKMHSPQSSSSCIYGRYGSFGIVKNNNFINLGAGYGQYYLSVGNIYDLDNNNTFSNGVFGYYSGNRTSLALWKSVTNKAQNSINVNPQFFSDSDLHTLDGALDGKGTPVTGITEDFDGDTRNTTVPDIGADEFTVYNRDAGIYSINSQSICPGTNMVEVTLRNYGLDSLISTTLQWSVSVNGGTPTTQSPFLFNGLVYTGNDTTLSIGSYSFSKANNYKIQVNVSGVNGSSDLNNSNDTASTPTLSPRMSGLYTVGTSPSDDWSTIDSAVSALETFGVCGPVMIYIKQGNYQEIVNIRGINGTNATNTITFLGDTATTTKPAWFTTSQPPITLDDLSYVKFENLNIYTTGSNYTVYFNGELSHITFENNIIAGRIITNTSANYSVIFNPNQAGIQAHHISFINNDIVNGSYGVYWAGYISGTQYEYGNKFENNTFTNQYFSALYLSFQDSLTVTRNDIQLRDFSSSCHGINIENSATYEITKNKVYIPRGGYGIYLNGSSGSVSNYADISNNFVVVSGVYTGYGIYTVNSSYLKVYHNSIHSFSTNSGTSCAYLHTGSNMEVKNNSLFNSGTGYAIRVTNNSTYIGDYNNLYSNGNTLGYYSGNRTSLSAWSTITGDDINSVSVNPNYKDSFDLHSTNANMNNAGTPLGILHDIDGDLRSTTSPDIGADEYTAFPRDLNLKALSENFCEGTQSITLDLTNSGTQPVTAGKISWSVSVNGGTPIAQNPVNISGSLASLKDTTVTLGNLVLNRGDYYDILVYVDSVNGNLDQNILNDTLRVDSMYATMTGTYTVGGSNPDFTTMSAATSALNTRGVCGKVFINVRPGIYNDRIYLPNAIEGSDTANTITFQTDTAFFGRAELSNSNYVAYLEQVDNVRIKNLKLNHTGTVATFKGTNVNNIILDSNEFIGYLSNNNIVAQSVIYFSGGGVVSSGLTITNNTITNGSRGINFQYGVAPTDILISNNNITNYREYGMFISRADDIEIDHNTIKNNQTVGARTYGIYGELLNMYSIHANKIDLDGLNYSTGARGIYLNVSYGTSSTWSYVFNNFVTCDGSSTNSGVGDGILLTNCTYVQVDHNSVNHLNSNPSSCAFRADGCSNFYIRNNSFVNQGGGYAIRMTNLPILSNRNNLYTVGTAIGFYSGARNTLVNWRVATAQDQQSISTDPFYYSATDLHTSSFNLNGAGMNVSHVLVDIDGESRTTSSRDIGADQFTPLQRDASITEIKELFCAGLAPVKVSLQNYGTQNITSAKINWWLSTNGSTFIPQPSYTFTGNIASGNSINATIASYNFQDGNTYSYMAVIDSVNGSNDLNAVNDTARRTNFKPAMSGEYTVGLNADFNSISEADSALDIAGVCGPVTLNLLQGTFNESVEMGNYEGVSKLNLITIQADSNNTAGVYWSDSISPLKLVNAEFITVKGLNLTSTSSGNALYLNGKAHELKFIDNVFTGINTTSTFINYSTVFYHRTTTDTLTKVSFVGNEMHKGSYGVYIYGTSNNRFSGVEFKDNFMTDYRYNGLELGYVDSLIVEENEFKNSSNGYGTTAITVLYSNQLTIQNNKVDHTGLGGRTALYVGWSNGTISSRNTIANNFLSSNSNNFSTTLDLKNNTYCDIYYNSVNAVGNALNSKALFETNGVNNRYLNNNFINSAGGYAVYVTGSNVYSNSDYNNLYSNGTTRFGYYKNTNVANISNWRTLSGQDANSVNGDPYYKSANDLHALGLPSNNTGTPIAGFIADIDGQLRSTTTPDIGADEFTASPNDAGLDSLSDGLFCLGSNAIYATLTNYGTQTLTSVTINWSVVKNYGLPVSQPMVNWTGSLTTGQSAIVNLGNFNFSNDTTYQFFAYTNSPNNNIDGFFGNDSVSNSANKTAMSGTYIVAQQGGGDYATLLAAVNDLNLRGVCAPTTIKVRTGTYANAVSISKIEGASNANPVVIESDSSNLTPAVLSSTTFTVRFNNAEYVTLRGFTINSLNKSPVHVTGSNNTLVIQGNAIENNTSVYWGQLTENAGISISNTTNQANTDISLFDNTIKGGYYGIYYGNAVKSNGATFKGNLITDFKSTGVVIQNDFDVLFENNSVLDSTFSYADRGMEVSNCNIDIIGNRVVINSNYFGRGIYILYAQDTSSVNRKIVNNAITVIKGSSNNNTSGVWGLSMYNCVAFDIYHNSVSIEGGSNTSSRAFSSLSSTNANVINNSFSNLTDGYAMYFSHSQGIASSDYNNLYTTGTNLIYGVNGNHSTLTGWRNATVFGNNSTSANPNYMTPYEMRPNHIALDGTANNLASITNDIEGVTRGTNPDIGAYQFNTRKDDAGSVALVSKQLCNGTQNVVFALKNFGGDTLKSVQVAWSVSNNGGAYVSQPNFTWNGILPPGDIDSNVVVGTYTFSGGNYRVESFTTLPNGVVDELFTNDTINEQLYVQFNGTYTVGGVNPDFVNWKSFAESINDAGVCGSVVVKVRPGIYNESIILKDISGLSANNSLTITRDTGLGNVVLSDTNIALTLENLKYVTIKNIEFKNTGSLSALKLEGANSYITIDSNSIVGPYSTSASIDESAIYVRASGVSVNDHLILSNNKISNGSMGLYIAGSSNIKSNEKIQVFNNTISEFDAYGMYIYSADSIGIDSNVITSSAIHGKTSSTGIYFNLVTDYMVSRNTISVEGETAIATGVSLYKSHGTSILANHFVNNFVHVLEGNGMHVSNSNYLNVYFNSVHISKAKYNAGYAFRLYNSFGNSLLNNSFANLAGGYVFYDYNGFNSNYNNLYTTGQLITRNNIQTIANWRTLSGQDANSVTADPIYLSSFDLHANQTLLDSSATGLGSFNTDIDGELRDPSFPDIGADEFTLIENVGIVEVLNPSNKRARKWTSTAFSGLDTIEVVVRNFGPPAQDIPIEMQFLGMVQQDTLWGTLNAGSRDTFKFPIPLNLDTVGVHNIRVFTAMQNDQYIEDDTLDLTVVTLENEAVKLPFVVDFEGIKDTSLFESHLGLWDAEEWDFASNGGRLQTKSGKKATGEQAITLDRTPNGSTVINELILNLNMTRYDINDSVFLSFDFIDHRDERHPGDSVWVRGSDTSAWVGVFDLWRNRRTNRVKEIVDLDVTSALAQAGQNYSTSFQVRFGQEDNQKLPGDGRTFDNIVLRAVHPYDLEISGVQVEYSQVPVEMASNRFHSTITNKGYLTADSASMNVNVAGYSNKLIVGSLVSDADTSLSITDSLGTLSAGVYTAFVYSDFDKIDKNTDNDSIDINFSLTDTVLARDNNVVDTTFGFIGGAGEMGTVLEVFKQDTVTSVSFYLNFPTVGDTLRAHIYEFINDTVGSQIVNTEYWVVNSNASRWYTLPIKCLEALEAGKYLVSVEQASNNYLTLGLSKDNYLSGASFIKTGVQWGVFEDSLSGYLFNIHANFGKYDLPSINTPAGLCLNDDPIVLKSNFTGGVFTGTGVVNDTLFNPSLAGVGIHFVTYSLLKPNGCYDSNGVEVVVDSIPRVTLTSQADICENGGLLTLSGGLPSGGVYFGTGVTGTRFNPTVTGSGSQTINYRYAKPISGCSDTASVMVRVKQVPSVSLGAINDFCLGDSAVILTQGSPFGGKYQGTGVANDSIFSSITAGLGSFKITYEFVDTNLCSDTASQFVTVNDTPKVDLGSDTVLCFQTELGLSGQSIGTYKWSTGDTTEHLWVTEGGIYWLETTSLKGCVNSDTITVRYDGNCVGVGELGDLMNVELYPNPTTGTVNLKFNDMEEGNVQIVVRNIYGQELNTITWTIDQSNSIQTIDLTKEAVGVYFLDITTSKGRFILKVNLSR